MFSRFARWLGFGTRVTPIAAPLDNRLVPATEESTNIPIQQKSTQPERIKFVNDDPNLVASAPVDPSSPASPTAPAELPGFAPSPTTTPPFPVPLLSSSSANPTKPVSDNSSQRQVARSSLTEVVVSRPPVSTAYSKPKSAPAQRTLGTLNNALTPSSTRAQSAGGGKQNHRLVQPTSEFSLFSKRQDEAPVSSSAFAFNNRQPIDPLGSRQVGSSSNGANDLAVFSQKEHARPVLDPFSE